MATIEKKIRLGIVSAQFNFEITTIMKNEAEREAKKLGAEVVAILDVPGAYEIPFAAGKLLARKDIDSVATLGAVIKGETAHDEVITRAICSELLRLSSRYGKPIGLGITGPGQTEEQARARAEDYAHRSVRAALHMAKLKYSP